ncbi:16S rRNA (adenine(1518)-N(6)/adenine(1519)-N(6))-dimethyltransferase, partial [Mycobacterium sp. ITM-2017-0098]
FVRLLQRSDDWHVVDKGEADSTVSAERAVAEDSQISTS